MEFIYFYSEYCERYPKIEILYRNCFYSKKVVSWF